jgi:hypothetical protein
MGVSPYRNSAIQELNKVCEIAAMPFHKKYTDANSHMLCLLDVTYLVIDSSLIAIVAIILPNILSYNLSEPIRVCESKCIEYSVVLSVAALW